MEDGCRFSAHVKCGVNIPEVDRELLWIPKQQQPSPPSSMAIYQGDPPCWYRLDGVESSAEAIHNSSASRIWPCPTSSIHPGPQGHGPGSRGRALPSSPEPDWNGLVDALVLLRHGRCDLWRHGSENAHKSEDPLLSSHLIAEMMGCISQSETTSEADLRSAPVSWDGICQGWSSEQCRLL